MKPRVPLPLPLVLMALAAAFCLTASIYIILGELI